MARKRVDRNTKGRRSSNKSSFHGYNKKCLLLINVLNRRLTDKEMRRFRQHSSHPPSPLTTLPPPQKVMHVTRKKIRQQIYYHSHHTNLLKRERKRTVFLFCWCDSPVKSKRGLFTSPKNTPHCQKIQKKRFPMCAHFL